MPDKVWNSATDHARHVLCLACFTQRADDAGLRWEDGIEFFPVSLATHRNFDDNDPPADPLAQLQGEPATDEEVRETAQDVLRFPNVGEFVLTPRRLTRLLSRLRDAETAWDAAGAMGEPLARLHRRRWQYMRDRKVQIELFEDPDTFRAFFVVRYTSYAHRAATPEAAVDGLMERFP